MIWIALGFPFISGYWIVIVFLLAYIIPLILSILLSTGRLPYGFVEFFRRHGYVVLLSVFIVLGICLFPQWAPILLFLLSSSGIEYASAITGTTSVAMFGALIVIAFGIHSKSKERVDIGNQIGLHYAVCKIAKIPLKEVRKPIRHGYGPLRDETFRNDLKHSEIRAQVSLGFYLFLLDSLDPSMYEQVQYLVILLFYLPVLPFQYWAIKSDYDSWKRFWISYWIFIRNSLLPDSSLVDGFPRLPRPIRVRASTNERESLRKEALLILRDLELSEDPSFEELEWVYWFIRINEKIKHLSEQDLKVINAHPILADLVNDFKNIPKKYDPDSFVSLVRRYLLLDLIDIAQHSTPIFDSMISLNEWSQNSRDTPEGIQCYELSVRESQSLHDLPEWPVPSIIKWLIGFSLLMLTLTPYLISILSVL
jgi:hypothetical protein